MEEKGVDKNPPGTLESSVSAKRSTSTLLPQLSLDGITLMQPAKDFSNGVVVPIFSRADSKVSISSSITSCSFSPQAKIQPKESTSQDSRHGQTFLARVTMKSGSKSMSVHVHTTNYPGKRPQSVWGEYKDYVS